MMRKRALLLLFFSVSFAVYSQDFSNKGKDFWVGYGYHQVMRAGNSQQMVLYFATDQVTNVTVSIPGTGYTQTYSNIPAGTVFTSNPLPKAGAQDATLQNESTAGENKGIHIESDKPIVAYAHIYNANVSGASILFPTNTLGKEYYSINYTNISNTTNANCWFYVIACDTGTTTVEIIPSANTLSHAAGVPFSVTLTQGQVYNVMGQYSGASGVDLTGSKIRSIATASGGCKRIAVFSGSGRIAITCTGGSSSSDNYMVQSFPKNAWGRKYLTVPTGGMPNNIYRICVSDPAAAVRLNGAPISYPLINNFYYEIPAAASPLKIESDLPITVAQYITSQGACQNPQPGDPEVIYLSPVEQNISTVIWNATPNFAINAHYFSVVIPNTGTAISSFKLDGVPVNPALFTVHPQDPGYSYLTQSVGALQRKIESDSGFNAIAYGFGSAESYGYNAGTNVRDLYQRVGVTTLFSVESTPSVCTGSLFKFKVSLPYLVDSLRWNLSKLPGAPANILKTYSNPPSPSDADSTVIVNGKTIYWYSLDKFFNFNTVGIFPVNIIAYASNSEGCGNEQQIDFDLEISNPPVADFKVVFSGCINEAAQFSDQTNSVKPTYKWWWNFGDPASGANNISTLKNPVHNFSAPGTYTVRFANITTPGCFSDTISKQVVVHPLPTAAISGDITTCQNSPQPAVVFTGIVGTAPFAFRYTINNGAVQTITSTTGNSVSLPVSTATLGTFSYKLISVTDAAGTPACFQNQPDTVIVQVNPLPTATISGATTICQNAASPLITFTGSGTVAPYTFTYEINGGPPQKVTTTSGNSVTIPVSTSIAGSYKYTLVSIQDGNTLPAPCFQLQSSNVTVTVNPVPTAGISGSTEVCINAPSPFITFTGAGGIAPYIFSYTLNGGATQTITSTGNTANITVNTSIPGNFTYRLLSVRDAGSFSCSQPQTGTAIITVNPLPTGNFNFSAPSCVTSTVSFTDLSVPNAGVLNKWTWNFGDPSSGAANTSLLQNPTHIYTSPGVYTVSLIAGNDKGCTGLVIQKTITINMLPKAGFILPEVCLLDPFAVFTDSSAVTGPSQISSWQWNFGDPGSGVSNTSSQKNAQHAYSSVGNYNVSLIVRTNAGCTDSLSQSLTVNGGNPQAAFTPLNANTACSSDTISIQNKSTIASGNITKVEIYWDNIAQPGVFEVDDFPVFNKMYKHKYPSSTNTIDYTIRFRAYSGGVCVNDVTQVLKVFATPDVTINNIPDQCYSTQPVALNFGVEKGGLSGTASYSGPGVSNAGGWVFVPSDAGIGTHIIQYKFTATAGGCTDSITTSIRVLDTASARFSVVSPICERNAVRFNDLSTAPAGSTIRATSWDFGDGSPIQQYEPGESISHTYAVAGNYNVSMYNTSSLGCRSALNSQLITVSPTPKPDFNFPDSICLPAAAVAFNNRSIISDGSENAFVYLWNFGDPASGTLNSSVLKDPVHRYSGTGPFNVRLQVTSSGGCVHDTTMAVNTIHPQPKADFAVSKPAICIGDTVSFEDKSNGRDGTINKWNWSFDDGSGSTEEDPAHQYTAAKTYNVSLYITNSFGCNSDTVVKPFNVYAFPLVDAGPDKIVLVGGTVMLDPIISGLDNQYLWEPASYLDNSRLARPTSSPLQDITYKITVSNPGGCSASDDVFIQIKQGPNIPNTFSPNGDGINESWIIEYLFTYPNCRVKVFTRQGQLVFESRGYKVPWNGTMNGKTLPIDTYYYIIEPENGLKPLTGYVTIVK